MKLKSCLFVCSITSAILMSPASADSYTDATATGAWNTARWNNTTDAAPYTSTYTAGNAVQFTSGTYSFAGMGASINVGNVTLANNVTVNFASIGSTYGTGGNVRTITTGTGALFDLNSNSVSTTAGTGFIKNGSGTWALAGAAYTGGFTLNQGTLIARGVNAMGAGGSLTINGGAIGANATRNLSGKYTGITVGGDFQLGVLASAVAIASDAANLTFDSAVSLGASTRKITLGGIGTYTLGGVLSGASGTGLTVDALSGATDGTLVLSGNNSFDGGLTINSGRVELGHNNAAGAASNTIQLAGSNAFLQTGSGINVGNAITVADNGDLKSLRHFNSTNAGTFSGNITINESTVGNFNTNIGAGAQLSLAGTISGSGGAGLSKIGAGTLVISGTSTYSGLLRANNGTTTLSATGSMDAISATIGSTNSATLNLDDNSVFGIDVVGLGATSILSAASGAGTATLNLNGDFLFDLTLADLTNGNIWQIVDNANIVETFGSTFNVPGFTENSNVWTKVDGNNTWTFAENSGQLSLAIIPEPAAALLGGLGFLALLRRRR